MKRVAVIIITSIVLTLNVMAADVDSAVIIDAGHGGSDGGTSYNGIYEKDINLKIAIRLDALFTLFGYDTVMLRTEDVSLDTGSKFNKSADLKKRIEIINGYDNKVLISIHTNAFSSTKYSGAQMFYSENAKELSEKTMTRIKALQKANTRTAKPIEISLYLYRNIDCETLLAECGFLSNDEERNLLCQDDYLTKIAMALFSGYIDYICTEV